MLFTVTSECETLHQVLGEVLRPDVTASAAYPVVAKLTVQLLRDMAISDVLYRRPADADALIIKLGARMVRCQLSSQEENR